MWCVSGVFDVVCVRSVFEVVFRGCHSSLLSALQVAPTATSGQSNGVALAGSGPLTNGRGSPPTEGRSLGHLFMVDSGKEVRLVRGSEGFGCVLRYFTIQEDHSVSGCAGCDVGR